MVPETQVDEAAMVPGMTVIAVRSLAQVVAVLRDDEVPTRPPWTRSRAGRCSTSGAGRRISEVDLADVLGMADARYALGSAAAGGHHLMLSGPKGAGKTTLAERIPGLLPDPPWSSRSAQRDLLAGRVPARGPDHGHPPPFRAPHHSASRASLLGGGSGRVRPGR